MTSNHPGSSSAIVVSRSKLVVRRLPPTLPENVFWRSVSTWVTEETCSWKRFNGHPVHSRAYCLMSTTEAPVNFHRGFDGHVFRSKTGGEYQAVVEYASVQKTPHKAKVKVDARQSTIDDDPDYLSFLESLNATPSKPVLEVSVPAPQPTITPLIEHLRAAKNNKSQAKAAKLAQSSSTEDGRRNAALTAVASAAARRTPQGQVGPTMVAGKGREVTITPTSSTETAGSGDGAKKKGKRGRGGSPSRGSQPSIGPHGSSGLVPLAAIPSTTPSVHRAPSPGSASGDNRGVGRGRGGRGGRGRGRGEASISGARGRGGGTGDRSPHNAVLQILTKNSDVDRGRGRGGGRGGIRGGRGGLSEPSASQARIDM